MPRYQILAIMPEKGNEVFLPHAIELTAESVKQAGERLAETFFELGVNIQGIKTVVRMDVEESWEAEPEKPNLFNENGNTPDGLPKKRKPGRPKGTGKRAPLVIADQREDKRTRHDGLTYE